MCSLWEKSLKWPLRRSSWLPLSAIGQERLTRENTGEMEEHGKGNGKTGQERIARESIGQMEEHGKVKTGTNGQVETTFGDAIWKRLVGKRTKEEEMKTAGEGMTTEGDTGQMMEIWQTERKDNMKERIGRAKKEPTR